jgi:hypothetical protein
VKIAKSGLPLLITSFLMLASAFAGTVQYRHHEPNRLDQTGVLFDNIRAKSPNVFMEEIVVGRVSVLEGTTGGGGAAVSDTTTQPWDFGKVYPNGYKEGGYGFTNGNAVTIQLRVTLPSNPHGAYTIESGGGNHDVAPDESHTVTVRLTGSGQSAGTKTGQLRVEWWDGSNNFQNDVFDLTGEVAQTISLDGYGMDVATYLNESYTGTCRLENNGSLPLAVNSMSLSGDNPERFHFVSGNGSGTIPAGEYRDIQVRYRADAHGTHQANISMEVAYDDLEYEDILLPLKGTAYYKPDFSGSYGRTFGKTDLGNALSSTCLIKNSGDLSLEITSIGLTGTDAARFELTGGTSAGTLTSGQSREIEVRYLADAAGSHDAAVRVSFTYDGWAAHIDLPLSGETQSLPCVKPISHIIILLLSDH